MSTIVEALKNLGKKLNTGGTEPDGLTIAEVLDNIEEDFDITGAQGAKGDKGDTGATGAAGASVTAIALETTEGAVTGGTATLSDGTTVDITVTAAAAEG